MRTEQESYDVALNITRILLSDKKGDLTRADISEGVDRVVRHFGTEFKDERLRLRPFDTRALCEDLAERFEVTT